MGAPNGLFIALIVARARNGVIGRDGQLPWHLPSELRHFRMTTMHHPLIMGRTTYESIGRALPGRRMIVLTRMPNWHAEGCERASSIDEAFEIARGADAARPEISSDHAFVAGGASVYTQAMPYADQVLLTQLLADVNGDTMIDAPDPREWELHSQRDGDKESPIQFVVQDWRRRSARA